MKILVTGSSGHLGEAICRVLKKRAIDYIGIDIKEGAFTNKIGSITDNQIVLEIMDGIDFVIHSATLHKPHIVTHSKQDFIDVNISGTLSLLEAARVNEVKGFIYTSTTSTFGDALKPKQNGPAIWVTEQTTAIPKNIYGVTKTAAENLCQLYYRNHQLPCIVLKTSRFFLEEDDNKETREMYHDLNIKANEFLYRRVDIEDVVDAHLLAIEKVKEISFQKYIISATTPFAKEQLRNLQQDANKLVAELYPEMQEIYARQNWKMFSQIGRVYVNEKARTELAWNPKYDFKHVLECIKNEKEFRSSLALQVGAKGYHDQVFTDGPYPIDGN